MASEIAAKIAGRVYHLSQLQAAVDAELQEVREVLVALQNDKGCWCDEDTRRIRADCISPLCDRARALLKKLEGK